MREVEALRAKGLIQGASTENAIVLDETGVVENALRWPDEFVRHKAMDCVGDLALAGARVRRASSRDQAESSRNRAARARDAGGDGAGDARCSESKKS